MCSATPRWTGHPVVRADRRKRRDSQLPARPAPTGPPETRSARPQPCTFADPLGSGPRPDGYFFTLRIDQRTAPSHTPHCLSSDLGLGPFPTGGSNCNDPLRPPPGSRFSCPAPQQGRRVTGKRRPGAGAPGLDLRDAKAPRGGPDVRNCSAGRASATSEA